MSESVILAGKVRKYDVAIDRGQAALNALQPRLAELVGEALPENPAHAPGRARRQHSSH